MTELDKQRLESLKCEMSKLREKVRATEEAVKILRRDQIAMHDELTSQIDELRRKVNMLVATKELSALELPELSKLELPELWKLEVPELEPLGKVEPSEISKEGDVSV
ncbi:MAG: hypothetical protein K2Z81_01255 [Cyanobacteria bacterium]|nr:hypothetical protein [Cyanobacteriota bacterium]